MARLTGKRAVVTGAGSGIGQASAVLFAAEEMVARGGGAIVCTASVATLRANAGGLSRSHPFVVKRDRVD
ncbi:MAG: hypothetical protein QF926_00735 [Alphaproteobacteria bacterium]|jgi:hypothetical protein|nr:hypothetical protein [Alphaproteobacteria bacterium]MDP6515135.1 hypothetical protein [Alphaproteobacteria bacterium]